MHTTISNSFGVHRALVKHIVKPYKEVAMSKEVATNYSKESSARVQIFVKMDIEKTKFERKNVFQ